MDGASVLTGFDHEQNFSHIITNTTTIIIILHHKMAAHWAWSHQSPSHNITQQWSYWSSLSSSPKTTLSTTSSLQNTHIISDRHYNLAQVGSGWSHRTWSLLPKICCPGLQSPHCNCAPSLYPGDYFGLILMSGDHLILRLT